MLTHYERAGNGRVVLVLPGWADTATSWLPFQRHMSQSFDVIILDIPGFGGSQAPETAWNLEDYTNFINHFLAKLGIKKTYAVLGHSNGGAMAIRGVATAKLHSDKLLLAASAGIRNEQQSKKGTLRILAKTGKALSKPLPASVQSKLRARLYTAIGSDMLVAQHMKETFKNIVTDDVQDDAGLITTPTMLVYGDKDTETPPRHGEKFHELIEHSELRILPGADHFLHVHNTQELVAVSKGFLR